MKPEFDIAGFFKALIGHRSSVIGHRSSVIGHRSSVAGGLSSARLCALRAALCVLLLVGATGCWADEPKDEVGQSKSTETAGEPNSSVKAKLWYDVDNLTQEQAQKVTEQLKQKLLTEKAIVARIAAQRALGKIYLKGIGGEQNIDKSIEYLTPAANAGDGEAQSILATIYSHPALERVNEKLFLQYAYLSAKNGEYISFSMIGKYYFNKKNYEKSYGYMRYAACNGVELSRVFLANLALIDPDFPGGLADGVLWLASATTIPTETLEFAQSVNEDYLQIVRPEEWGRINQKITEQGWLQSKCRGIKNPLDKQ